MKKLSRPPTKYDEKDQIELRQAIQDADKANLKKGQDIELSNGRLIGTSPSGTRFALVFNDDGTLGTAAP